MSADNERMDCTVYEYVDILDVCRKLEYAQRLVCLRGTRSAKGTDPIKRRGALAHLVNVMFLEPRIRLALGYVQVDRLHRSIVVVYHCGRDWFGTVEIYHRSARVSSTWLGFCFT